MTNPLKIYSGSNALLYTTPINTGCRRRVQLMNEDSITVKFSDKTKMKFPVGTRIGDFYITKEQQEKYNATTGGYDYELKFDAYYWLWANRLLFYVMPGVTNAPKETSFKLTATIDVHAAVILRCLSALGFKYNDSPFRVDTDAGFSTEAKYISYANMSILGGIQAIADAYECEWWVVGNSIHFGKCNAIGEYNFTVGENVASITSDSKTTTANRLVFFGSTRNLPPNYRTPESSDVVDAVVVKRLMLPEGTPYLQTSPDIPEDEIVEEEVVLDSVYPRTALSVTDVETYDSTAQDGNTQTFYRIKYGTAFHFSKDYILPDEELHVVFESGDLNGMDFAVKFNPLGLAEKKDDGSINPDAQMLEIVPNEDYGRLLPDTVLHPSKTDRFSLYGWDSTKMEALGLLAAAEQELLTEGNKLLDEYRKDKQTYTCPMMWDWCKEQAEEGNSPRLGSVVNLHFVAGDTGRKSRIIGYEHDLDIEYSNVTYICGEKVSVSRLKTLESKVEGLTHDGTKVKVQNSLDFLSKRYSDRTPYQLASDMGFDVGQFLASVSGGRFGIDKVTGQSFLEVDRIFARVRAYFESLTVVERESLAGEQMVTPGGGVKCTSVEEVRNTQNVLTGWRCYFLSEQDGEKRETKIIVGDQAIAQTFNAKAGTTNKVSNHRWWRLVTGVSNNAYTDDSGNIYGYIEVSKSDCETDSDTPKEGDDVIQFGNRTDKTRQAAILISTVATDAPSIKLLTGIDHYSLVGKDIISQGYDAAKGHAYFRCYGDTYIGAPDGSTYVKYDVDSKKLTVKADLEVGSTIGGKDAEDFVKDLIPEIPELTQEDIEDFVNNIVDPKIEGIQDQIDGVVESFFGFGAPTLSNYPANEWTTDELRKAHERDTYTDKTEYVDDVTTPTAGMSWKWQYTSPTDYGWVKIADSDATRALLDAARAQDTADGKRRTFTAQPVPPYDKGDIWVNATYPAGNTVKDAASGKYHNDILRCNTSRATGSFAIGDWGLASNYTDDTAALAAAAAAQAAKNAADAAQSAANAAQSSVTSLNDYVNGAFKDGIIDETEASGIANYINIVNADKERIDGTYQTLYANAYLSATGKAALKTAHDDVAAKITALISAINSAIADNKVTAAESAAVDSAFSAFSTSNKAFSAAVETANEEIQQTLKSAADAAKTAADNAKAAADAAKGVADAAKDRLDSWAADGVISPTEKQAIKDEIARIDADKAHIAAEYTRYSLGTPTDYNAAHSAYRAQLVTLSASTPESITIPPYFSANQTAYYNQRTAALSAIATAAKKYADDVAKEEAKKATDVYKYLKESLLNAQQESTEFSGGLILSTMMALGYTENGVKKILSGMNGSYVSSLGGRTIASWYGGHMLDLFDKNDSRIANPTGQEATSLIRMDGSFYFANGNIGGRTDGSGWLAGNNITWDASGAITFGNGIHIDLGSGNSTTLGGLNSKLSGVETTVGSVLTLVNALSNVLVPVNSSGTRVAWDSADLFAVKSVKGFYSEEFVSARGMSGQSSSISKYLTDLLDVGISAPASGQALIYNGSKWVNQAIQTGLDTTQLANYLTTNNYAKKSDIPNLNAYMSFEVSANYVNASFATAALSEKAKNTYIEFWDGGNAGWFNFQTGYLIAHGKVQGTTIVKEGGTSNQVLMADGSVQTHWKAADITSATSDSGMVTPLGMNNWVTNNFVTLATKQTIKALKTFEGGMKVSGRAVGSGDDEGIVIGRAANNYAGLILGDPSAVRSVFYLTPSDGAYWRWSDNNVRHDIVHPKKSGTIALTSDIPSLANYYTESEINTKLAGYLARSGGNMTGNIGYTGSKSTDTMIQFIDNTVDNNGNGIAIGGGGATIVGGGEAADLLKSTLPRGGDEKLILCNDQSIDFYTNCQNGIDSAVHTTISGNLFSGVAANANALGGNAPSYYATASALSTGLAGKVSKSGDTMSGTLSILGTSGNPYRYVRVGMQDAESLYLHNGYVDGGRGALLSIYSANANKGGIGVSLTRPFYQNASGSLFTLWHSGNDGSGSGLDADLWDGQQIADFRMRKHHTLDLSSLSTSNFYPIIFDNTDLELDCEIHSPNLVDSAAYNQNHIHFLLTAQGWTDTAIVFRILSQGVYSTEEITIGAIGYGTRQGEKCVWVRGGMKYRILSNHTPTLKTSSYTVHEQTFSVGTNLYGGTNTNVEIAWQNNSTRSNSQFAVLSSNVASATKLATARTLWGQSFNGTGNVSGNMTGVGSITASGLITNTGNLRLQSSASGGGGDVYAELWRGTSASWRLLNTAGVLKFQCNYTYAAGSYFDCMTLAYNTGNAYIKGSVGIGTASPSRKLHVNGDIQTSSIYASNWLRTTDATGWYNQTYGGGWYMTDSTWIRTYGKHNIYANTGIIRTDYQFDRQGYAGSSWDSGYGAYNVAITNNSSQTPLMVAYRAGQSAAVTGANRLFALELLNSGTNLHYCFGGATKFSMSSAGVFYASAGIYSDGYVSARGQNTSSDERLKNILRPLSLNVRDIANAPSVEFIWRKDGIKDVGSIAQYWRKLIPQLAPDMPDGSMGLQYGKTALLASISNAREIVRIGDTLLNVSKRTETLEQKVNRLESEDRELKSQISQLKTQLA